MVEQNFNTVEEWKAAGSPENVTIDSTRPTTQPTEVVTTQPEPPVSGTQATVPSDGDVIPIAKGAPVPVAQSQNNIPPPPQPLATSAQMEYETQYAREHGIPLPVYTDEQLQSYQRERGYSTPVEAIGGEEPGLKVVSSTGGKDIYTVQIPDDKGSLTVTTMSEQQIQAQGKKVPDIIKQANEVHQVELTQGHEAALSKQEEFNAQNLAKLSEERLTQEATKLGSRYGVSPEAMLATIKRFQTNPDSDEFKLDIAGGSLTSQQKTEIAQAAGVVYDPLLDFTNITNKIRDTSNKAIISVASKTDIPISRLQTPTEYTQDDIQKLISNGVDPQDLVNAGISIDKVNNAVNNLYYTLPDGRMVDKPFLENLKENEPELYQIITTQGLDAYKEQFDKEYTKIKDGYMKTSDLSELKANKPELYDIAINQGSKAYQDAIALDIQKQKAADDVLSKGGYKTENIFYKSEALLGSIGKTLPPHVQPHQYDYDVSRFIRDNPTIDSIQVLKDAGFKKDVIDSANKYISDIQDVISKIDNARPKNGVSGLSLAGIDEQAFTRALVKNNATGTGVPLEDWKQIKDDSLKGRIVSDYNNDSNTRNPFANLAATYKMVQDKSVEGIESQKSPTILKRIQEFSVGAGMFTPIATAGLIDQTVEFYKQPDWSVIPMFSQNYISSNVIKNPLSPDQLVINTVKGIGETGKVAFAGGSEGAVAGGQLAIMLLPFKDVIAAPIEGVVNRLRPDTLTSNALALTEDVGRVQLPKGMSSLAARQILEDIESAHLTGNIPIERLAAYTDISKGIPDTLKSVDIVRVPEQGTVDVVLRSADGNAIGHVSGFQRIANDVVFHATGDTETILKEIQDKGYFEVSSSAGKHPVMYFSPQAAQSMIFRNPGDSPGIIALRITNDMWKQLPKEVLDSPNLQAMRETMFRLAEEGKLEPGLYPLSKGYGSPTTFEYEVIAAPNTKIYPLESKWYAPDNKGAPMTRFTSDLNYDGSPIKVGDTTKSGKPVRFGQQLPMYWMGSEEAIALGKGVPSVIDMYAAKLAGDLTAFRKWMPWELRLRSTSEKEVPISSPNPLASAYKQLSLKATPEDVGAGRVSGIIYNEDGKVLLTRTQGQTHYDLPGGGAVAGETIDNAMVREIFEETGLKPTYVEHVDTLNSAFTEGGKSQKFQVFNVEATGRPLFGREVAEYVWWDGKSKLNYDIAPFTKEAIARYLQKTALLDNLTVTKIIDEAIKRAEAKVKTGVNRDLAIADELQKVVDDAERATIPYKSMINNKALALSSLEASSNIVNNEPPQVLQKYLLDDKAIISKGVVDVGDIKTVSVPKEISVVQTEEMATEYKPTGETLPISEPTLTKEPTVVTEKTISPETLNLSESKPVSEIKTPTEPKIPTEAKIPSETKLPSEPTFPTETKPPTEKIPTKEPITPTTTITIPKKKREAPEELINNPPIGTVVLIQGRPQFKGETHAPMFKVVPPPYEDMFTTRQTPKGYVDEGFNGEGSAFKSIQVIGGKLTKDVENLDLGIFRINIKMEGGKPVVSYAGDLDSNSGERTMTVGMGKKQIPIEEWETAKSEGKDFATFVKEYKGHKVGEPHPEGRSISSTEELVKEEPKIVWVRSAKDIPDKQGQSEEYVESTKGHYDPETNTIYGIEEVTTPFEIEHEKYHAMKGHSEIPDDPRQFVREELEASKYAFDKVGEQEDFLGTLRAILNDLTTYTYDLEPQEALQIFKEEFLKVDPPISWREDFVKLEKEFGEAYEKKEESVSETQTEEDVEENHVQEKHGTLAEDLKSADNPFSIKKLTEPPTKTIPIGQVKEYAEDTTTRAVVEPRATSLNKVELVEYSTPKTKVFLVDGDYVRDHYDIDFTQGSNWKVTPYIPKYHYWIENNMNEEDTKATILHELAEVPAMGDGRGRGKHYGEAHYKAAIPAEQEGRSHPERLDSMIESILDKYRDKKQTKEEPQIEEDALEDEYADYVEPQKPSHKTIRMKKQIAQLDPTERYYRGHRISSVDLGGVSL